MNLDPVTLALRCSSFFGRPDLVPNRDRSRGKTARVFERAPAGLEPLETRIAPATVFAVTTADHLIQFDSSTPTVLISDMMITGLQGSERMEAIEFRPATGELYGLGITDAAGADSGRIFKINPATAVATPVGAAPFNTALVDGADYGFDFNPTVDRIRITNSADQNLRVNPNDGTQVDFDPNTGGIQNDTILAFAGGDANAADNPAVVAVAYDRSGGGSEFTTLFGWDFTNDVLVRIGGVDGTPSPNGGVLTTINAVPPALFTDNAKIGLDIDPASGTMFMAATDGTTKLYTVSTATGIAISLGNIGAGATGVRGIAIGSAPNLAPTQLIVAGGATVDTLVVTATGANSGKYVLNNGAEVNFTGITKFTFDAGAGNDTFTLVNPSGSVFAPSEGIFYNGQGQSGTPGDSLVLQGGGGAAFTERYTPSSANNGTIVTTDSTTTQTITFTGLEPMTDIVTVATFDIDLTAAVNTANVTNGPMVSGFQTNVVGDGAGGTYEDITFANKTTVNVNGLNGGDTFSVNNSTPATGLTTLNLYGNQLSGAADDNASDLFSLRATAATVTTNFLGQGGTDVFRHIVTPEGANLDNVLGPVSFSGGTSAADNDALVLQDTLAGTADNVTLSSTQITGLAPATLSYDTIERVFIETTSLQDNVDILSTNLGTSYSVAGDGDSDTFTIGNTTTAFNTGPGTGDLANIQGLVVISPDSNLTAGTADVINVDDSGSTTALAAASISNLGSTTVTIPLDNIGTTVTSTANTTELAGFAPAAIRYFHDTVGGTLPSPNNRLETLSVRGSQGNDTITINATTAITQSTVDAREGEDILNIAGDTLSAANVFQGDDDPDEFALTITANIGATAFAPVTSVQIEGNDAASDTVDRDRLTINDSAASRFLNYQYLSQASGDLDIKFVTSGSGLFGAADKNLQVRTMETVVFKAPTDNDVISVTGTTGNDVLTVGLLNNDNSALVFLGGTPYLGTAPVTLADSRPGVAGGGFGPDLLINGIDSAFGVTLFGGGIPANGGDRAVVYAPSENNLTDVGNPTDIFGFGAGVLIPGFGAGLAYDAITVDDTGVLTTNNPFGLLTKVLLDTSGSFNQGTPLNPAQQKVLTVNAGDEAGVNVATQIADDITGTLSNKFGIQVNGGTPVSGGANPFAGDRLSVATPADVSIFSDMASPPNVTFTSGASAPFGFSSIESVTFTPGNGSQVVNLIGDNNNPTVDQKDNFVVNGNFILPTNQRADVDANLAQIPGAQNEFQPDSDGDNEFYLFLNGSSPIGFRNVRTLNSFGDDQNPAPGTPSVGANGEDTLNVTPYADNTSNSRQWDIGVNFDEGNPSPGGILILNGVPGVPETVVVKKNGPESGTVTDTHATSNTTIVVINYTHVSNVIINQNPNEGDTMMGGAANFGFPGVGSNAFTAGLIYDLTQPVPLPGRSIPGKGSSAVAVGDVNADNIPDIVTANSQTNNLSILLGNGNGTFGVSKNISSGGKKPSDVALTDIDNDGDLDIVVANAGTKTVAVLKNNNGLGVGVFGAPVLTTLKLAPGSLAVGSLNGDNLPDVAVTHLVGRVSVLLNTAGTLGAPATVTSGGTGTSDVVIADFNNDGKADLAAANPVSGNVSFFLNAGAGVFSIAPQNFKTGVRPTGLAVADFNNDGKLDLAVSHTVSRFVGILLGNGAAATQFQPALHVNFPGRHFPKAIAAGDFNGDGKADLALGPREGAKLRIILGAGQGDFSQPFEFDLGREEGKITRVVSGIALADVNLDGELDIVTSNTSPSNDVSVLLRNLA